MHCSMACCGPFPCMRAIMQPRNALSIPPLNRAEGEEKKKTSSDKPKEKKEKKEGEEKEKKHKEHKDGDHKEKKHKDKDGDSKEKKEKKDKGASTSGSSSKKDKDKPAAAPAAPARRVPPAMPAKKGAAAKADDYLAGMDLPSTESEGEEVEAVEREDKGPLTFQVRWI